MPTTNSIPIFNVHSLQSKINFKTTGKPSLRLRNEFKHVFRSFFRLLGQSVLLTRPNRNCQKMEKVEEKTTMTTKSFRVESLKIISCTLYLYVVSHILYHYFVSLSRIITLYNCCVSRIIILYTRPPKM